MINAAGKKMVSFMRRQIGEILTGGLPVLTRKIYLFVSVLSAVPIILIVRLLRPLVIIRFGPLASHRIGHFTADTEVYLCERDSHMHGRRTFDIFYHQPLICNQQLKKMWDRTLCVYNFTRTLDKVNRLLIGGNKHVIPFRYEQGRDIHGLLAHTQPHIYFTSEEERLGETELHKLGIANGAPFICFHSRDANYLENTLPDMDWQYHSYRDSSIHNYVLAAEEMVRRGYYAIRVGVFVREVLNTANPMIIDYAIKHRTDFLDVFLGAKCRFFLCSTAGISAVSMIFRRPIARANYIPLSNAPSWGPNDLFIPKKLWLREEKRFLTFREILKSEIGGFLRSEQYERSGIDVIENTPHEVAALAVEMDERLKEKWQSTEEDEELQRRFWSLFKPGELYQVFLGRIGSDFLRENKNLLK